MGIHTLSETAECEALCKAQGEDGCCTLTERFGCVWTKGSTGVEATSYPEIAITCTASGNLSLSTFIGI